MSDASQQAAAAIMGDEATEDVEQPEDTAAETVQQEAETEEVPEDIRELLSQPDFEEEDDEQDDVALDEVSDTEYLEPDEAAKLRKRAVAAEKKAAYYEDLRAQDNRKKWVSEANRYFKYSDADSIQATSRRGFLKAAEAQHEAIKGRVEKALAEERAKDDTATAELRASDRQSARDAWGQPVETHGQTPASVGHAEKRETALRSGRFQESVRARLSDPDDPITKALS